MKPYSIFLLLLLSLVSCTKTDNELPTAPGYDYFPLKVGREWVYKIDSLAYDDNGPSQSIDTFTYQYKEIITDVYHDETGIETFVIERYYRANDSALWRLARSYTAQFNNERAIRTEENTKFVKLIFPLKKRATLNGNMFNGRETQNYRITEFPVSYAFKGKVYSSLKVQQVQIKNFIEEINRSEWYAQQIGMIEMSYDSLNTQEAGTKGFRIKQKLQSFTP